MEVKTIGRMLLTGLAACVLMISGCDSNRGYTHVDLTDKKVPGTEDLQTPAKDTLRVAISAMISPKETYIFYRELLEYLGKRIGYDILLVQRRTYAEVNALFPKHLIDLAFICSGPYATQRESYGFEGIATPVVRGMPYYQSYLIVQKQSSHSRLEDLKGKVFAFTDPGSNTGALVPRYWLSLMGATEHSFFKQIIYTYSHDNSIMAVAKGLVDGATVDGHKWEFYNRKNPYFTEKTRVIKTSEHFGGPPLVASAALAPDLKSRIQETMLSMHQSGDGRNILENLMIDRFEAPDPVWYEKIRTMHHLVGKGAP